MDKPIRIKSLPVIDLAKMRDGVCLVGLVLKDGCSGGSEVHHIKSRGSGGDDDLTNLIVLCRHHHIRAHYGQITRGYLRQVLQKYWKYVYTQEELDEL